MEERVTRVGVLRASTRKSRDSWDPSTGPVVLRMEGRKPVSYSSSARLERDFTGTGTLQKSSYY